MVPIVTHNRSHWFDAQFLKEPHSYPYGLRRYLIQRHRAPMLPPRRLLSRVALPRGAFWTLPTLCIPISGRTALLHVKSLRTEKPSCITVASVADVTSRMESTAQVGKLPTSE